MGNKILVFPKVADDGTQNGFFVLRLIDNLDGTYSIFIGDQSTSGAPAVATLIPASGDALTAAVSQAAILAALLGASLNVGALDVSAGDIKINQAGRGLYVKEGANASMGTGVLNGTTEVTIATTKVTANSRIFFSIQTPGGTPLGVIFVNSRIPGVSFGVKGAALDTSTFAWLIVEPA